MNIKEIKILLLGITIFLSGCMGMNSKFDCNVSSDGRCMPMGSIHKMADRGEFNEGFNRRGIENNNTAKAKNNGTLHGYPLDTFAEKPIRSAETIQQIWIGPYEDENSNYHEPSYVYAVVNKGKWIGEPEQMIQE